MQTELERLADDSARIGKLIKVRMQRLEGWLLAVRVLAVVGGSTIATAANFLPSDDPKHLPWRFMLGVGGAVVALLGGISVAFVDRDAPKAFEEARRAIEAAQSFGWQRDEIVAEVKGIRREEERQRHLLATIQTMRETVEHTLKADAFELAKVLNSMMDLSSRTLSASMGYGGSEKWTHAIYMADAKSADGIVLRRIAGRRADRSEEEKPAREWRLGEGFAGAAFQQGQEIILPNAQVPEVAAMLNVSQPNRRGYDGERYQSLAAVPIPGPEGGWWGVFVATSDKKRRFDSVPGSAGWTSVEAARMTAGMIALVAGIAHIRGTGAETTR